MDAGYSIFTDAKKRVPLIDRLPLQKPLSVFVEVSTLCNFKCRMCVRSFEETAADIGELKNMDFDDFVKIVDDLRSWPGEKLKLLRLSVLGEPLAHPRFCELLRLAKDADIAEKVDMITNGSLLTEQVSKELIEGGLDSIRISIYSVYEERHREVTQSEISPERIYNNILQLRKMRDAMQKKTPYIMVKMFDTFSEENDVFVKRYTGVADEIMFEKVHNSSSYKDVDLIGSFYGSKELTQKTKQQYDQSRNAMIACPRPFMSLTINKCGQVLCCTSDTPSATQVGDIHQESLRDIWNGERLFEFRKMHLENRKKENQSCRNCDWFQLFPAEDNVDGVSLERLKPMKGK